MSCNRNSTSRCWHLRPRSKVATGVVQKARQMKWPSFRYWSPYFGQEYGITIKMIPGNGLRRSKMFILMIDRFEYPCLRLLPTKSQQMVFHKERCNRQDNTGRNEFSSKCDQFLESDHVYHAYIGHVTLGYTVRVYIRLYIYLYFHERFSCHATASAAPGDSSIRPKDRNHRVCPCGLAKHMIRARFDSWLDVALRRIPVRLLPRPFWGRRRFIRRAHTPLLSPPPTTQAASRRLIVWNCTLLRWHFVHFAALGRVVLNIVPVVGS